jgi:predicted transcriptional regulator
MTLSEVRSTLEARVFAGEDHLERDVQLACGSDLMSDVLSFVKPNALLLTGLTNAQVVRTAEMADIRCVCFVRAKEPREETVKLAREKGLVLMSTSLTMYESCGRLYRNGLAACDRCT